MSLADALWAARLDGSKVTVADGDRPSDDQSAYAIQNGISAASGTALVGWKIGATAQAAMDLLGFTEPFFGPLYERFFHHTGDDIPIVADHGPGIETEFVVGMAADLPARATPYSKEEVEAAIAWVAPGFEVIGTRLSSGLPGAGNMLIADGGANMDFVLGPKSENWRDYDLTCHAASLSIDGADTATGHSGMLLFGDTIGAVVWLANSAHLAPRGLKAGDVITTGSCTGVVPIQVGSEASADFGAMGTVSARFVAA